MKLEPNRSNFIRPNPPLLRAGSYFESSIPGGTSPLGLSELIDNACELTYEARLKSTFEPTRSVPNLAFVSCFTDKFFIEASLL